MFSDETVTLLIFTEAIIFSYYQEDICLVFIKNRLLEFSITSVVLMTLEIYNMERCIFLRRLTEEKGAEVTRLKRHSEFQSGSNNLIVEKVVSTKKKKKGEIGQHRINIFIISKISCLVRIKLCISLKIIGD